MSYCRARRSFTICVALFHLFSYVSATIDLKDSQDSCSLPHIDATVVNCTRCGLDAMPKELSLYSNMRRLDLSYNNITSIDLNILSRLDKLTYIDFSHNEYLGRTIIAGYLIESPSLKYIDLSYSGFEVILPEYFHTPKLRTLKLLGSNDCDQTVKLFNETGSKIDVLCGGIALHPMEPKSKNNFVKSPPNVTTEEAAFSISQEGSNPTSVVTTRGLTSEAPTVSKTIIEKSTTKSEATPAPSVSTPDVRQTVPQTELFELGDQYILVRSILRLTVPIVIIAGGFLIWIFWEETKSILQCCIC